jgi:hypothetical protein
MAFLERSRHAPAPASAHTDWLAGYLQAAFYAANAVACLHGFPAAGRRSTLILQDQLTALGHPELFQAFLRLIGAPAFDAWSAPEVLSAWGRTFDAASDTVEPDLHPARRTYYLSGFQTMLDLDQPYALVHDLLRTWNTCMSALQARGEVQPHRTAWTALLERLHLAPGAVQAREQQLEAYQDRVEEALGLWGQEHGAWTLDGRALL